MDKQTKFLPLFAHAYKAILHLLLYLLSIMHADPVTGRCAVGAIAGIAVPGIVIVAVILVLTAVIIWCIHSHSKNRKPTNNFGENDHPNDGDLHLHAQPLNDGVLQIECQQMKRPQSYVQPLDTVRPKDSTRHTQITKATLIGVRNILGLGGP